MHKATQTFKRFRGADDGWVSVWTLFMILIMMLCGGVAIDYANGVRVSAQLQAAADAAALAAVIDLPDTDAATAAGLEVAAKHFSGALQSASIKAADFVYGNVQDSGNEFVAGATPFNAVRVDAERREARGNPVATFLMHITGIETLDVWAAAIAKAKGDASCRNGGFFSNSKNIASSNNDFVDGFCLYGKEGVTIGSNNSFEPGVEVGMRDLSLAMQSQDNVGFDDALAERTYNLTLPDQVPGIIASMQGGSLADLPSFINRVESVSNIDASTTLVSGTLYIVDDVADFGANATISNIAVVANKEIKVGSDSVTTNVVFATPDKILMGSYTTFGTSGDYCDTGKYNAYFFSGSNIEVGSNNYFRGVQMGAQDMIKLGSTQFSFEGVYAEATNNFEFGSGSLYGGCPNGLTSDFGTSSFALTNIRYSLIQ